MPNCLPIKEQRIYIAKLKYKMLISSYNIVELQKLKVSKILVLWYYRSLKRDYGSLRKHDVDGSWDVTPKHKFTLIVA